MSKETKNSSQVAEKGEGGHRKICRPGIRRKKRLEGSKDALQEEAKRCKKKQTAHLTQKKKTIVKKWQQNRHSTH